MNYRTILDKIIEDIGLELTVLMIKEYCNEHNTKSWFEKNKNEIVLKIRQIKKEDLICA